MRKFKIEGASRVTIGPDAPDAQCISLEGEGADLSVSDGFHTMQELYQHRYALFCAFLRGTAMPWRSREHHPDDAPCFEGYFIAGWGDLPGEQITYHVPLTLWDKFADCNTLPHAPKWDGHTSDDVLKRLWEP